MRIDACTRPSGHANDYAMVISLDIRLHSSCNARPSCWKLLQSEGLLRTRHHKTSHVCYICSIGGISCYLAGNVVKTMETPMCCERI